MSPKPCRHCGINFMSQSQNSIENLCNNCVLKDQIRNPKNKENKMSEISILIKIPFEKQKKIEEICIEQGIDYSKYFLDLHDAAGDVTLAEELFIPDTHKKKGKNVTR